MENLPAFHQTQPDQVDVSHVGDSAGNRRPWVTQLAVFICVSIFFGLSVQDNVESWAILAKFGYLPAIEVWRGSYWALVTSVLVHFEIWHICFNVYWLWVLGSRMEQAIGAMPYLCFIVGSAFVSSAFQLAASDTVGVGASGVVYAMFGFMWLALPHFPSFQRILTAGTIQLFLVWLAGCVVISRLGIMPIGNAAHISGLLFGAAVAGAFYRQSYPRLVLVALGMLIITSIVPLFWCPWSPTWLGHQAFRAHEAEQYDVAIEYYDQLIERSPENAMAHLNHSLIHRYQGNAQQADADLTKAREIDPTIEK